MHTKQKKFIFIISVLLNGHVLFAQNDTLNKFNYKGNKQGYWIKYLDDFLNPTDSINRAYYYVYELYDKDKGVIQFRDNSYFKLMPFEQISKAGNPIALDGHFIWNSKDSIEISGFKIVIGCVFEKGQFVYTKEFRYVLPPYRPLCRLDWIRYNTRYNNIPGTHLLEMYDSDNGKDFSLKKSKYYYKKNKHWRYHTIKAQSK